MVFGHRSAGVAVFEKHAYGDEVTGRNEGARACTVINELTNSGSPLTAVTLHLTLATLVKYHSVSTDLAVSRTAVLAPNALAVLAPLPPTDRAEKGRAPYDALREERVGDGYTGCNASVLQYAGAKKIIDAC